MINKIKVIALFTGQTQNILKTLFRGKVLSHKGFTLIEIIVTLLLVGILAALGGLGIVQATKGYITVKENSEITQKVQLAMTRITREIVEMNDIPSTPSSTVLPIKNVTQLDSSNNMVGNRTIGLSNNTIKMAFAGNSLDNGDVLTDNISSLNFTYYSGNATWTYGSNINLLSAIDVSITLIEPNMTFTTRVVPRNNGNLGGIAMPTVAPPSSPNYCFVATAAYGDPGHPMVQVLRDFRDKYLFSFEAGRWFVKKYYEYGPAASKIIEEHPFLMWIVRCLLSPFIFFAFCIMYAPLAMVFVIVVSLIFTSAAFVTYRRGFKFSQSYVRPRGSILLSLIFTMVVMAILAAVMMRIFSSSYMNQVYADQGRKAYFLAESGFNYASSEFLNAKTDSAKNAKLTEINGKTCNLLDNAGSFTLIIYPLWTVTGTLSDTTLPTTVSGSIADELKPSATGGYLKVGNNYYSYSTRTNTGDNTVTFTNLNPASGITSGLEALPVALPSSTTTVTNGGNLTLNSTGADVFPRLNGNFTVNGTGNIYHYALKSGNVLQNVTLADKTKTWANFTVTSGVITASATSKIVLEKFVRVRSTGTSGGATRTVVYNAPVGIVAAGGKFEKKQDDDLPNDINNWTPLSGGSDFGGTHGIASIDGGNALKVNTTSAIGLWNYLWAVSVFKGYQNTNLNKSWLDAGGFLSYDVQAKIRNTEPYFFAGINLRSRNNDNDDDLYTYGVSFVRARDRCDAALWGCAFLGEWTWYNSDSIDNDIISRAETSALFPRDLSLLETEQHSYFLTFWSFRYSHPAIIFWKRTGSGGIGTTKTLAYKILPISGNAEGLDSDSSSDQFRLKPWSTLLVRIAEGYSLTFTAGNTGTPIKEGDIVRSSGSSNWSARVVMTPILDSTCSWTGGAPCSGTLVLANVNGTYAAGNIQVNGVNRASTGTYSTTKKNYIKVYYGSTDAKGTANMVETDNNRLANPRGTVNWPPDDVTEITTSNDYFSLVTWSVNATDAKTSYLPASGNKIVIVDSELTTPDVTSSSTVYDFSGDAPAVVSGGDTATSTYYDDFAIQMDMSIGTGFLPPIQE